MLDSTVGQGSPTASVILALQIANPLSQALYVFLTYLVEKATLQDTVFYPGRLLYLLAVNEQFLLNDMAHCGIPACLLGTEA